MKRDERIFELIEEEKNRHESRVVCKRQRHNLDKPILLGVCLRLFVYLNYKNFRIKV